MANTRITKRKKETTLDDRLSSLSDDLLLCIIGNLETLEAVKTCALSRRWRNLWKSLTNLSFSTGIHESSRKRERAFFHFFTQVLLRRDHSDLVKFRLFPPWKTDPYLVESLLEYAIKHNVKFIKYCGLGENQRGVVFPGCFFDCSSLQGLELRFESYKCMTWPPHFNWPSLKSLYLENFIVGEGNFDGKIFSSCPSLETLKLKSLHTRKEKTLDIHSLSLRSLELVYCDLEHHYLSAHLVEIVAPNLTTFKFSGYKPVICSVDTPSLHNVTINLRPRIGIYSSASASASDQVSFDENARETILRSIKMVNEFHLAKSLSITAEAVEVLSAIPDLFEVHLRKFKNLKDLKLMTTVPLQRGEGVSISPRILNYFLRNSTAFKLECVKSKFW